MTTAAKTIRCRQTRCRGIAKIAIGVTAGALLLAGCASKVDTAAENDRAGDAAVAALSSPPPNGKAATTLKPGAKPGASQSHKPSKGTTTKRTTTTRPAPTTKPVKVYDEDFASTAPPMQATVFGDGPFSGFSATRNGQSMVRSAGGYVAKTPETAHGMLFEPKWGPDEQPVADMLHRYIDEEFATLTDGKISPAVSPWMASVQRPDPGAAVNATNDEELIEPMGRIKDIAEHNVEYRGTDSRQSYVFLRYAKVTGGSTANDPAVIFWKACERSMFTLYSPSDPNVTGSDKRSVLYEIVTLGVKDPKILRFEATARRNDGGGYCGN